MPEPVPLLAALSRRLAALDDQQLRRRLYIADTPAAPVMTVDGQPLVTFCSNDYLGLAADARVVAALGEGAALYGAGSGASHLISGHSRAHALLEERLAALLAPHLDAARALYFSTGYMANLAVLSAMADRDAVIFSESLNHASLIDGARLSRAQVQIFPHRDLAALEAQLAGCTADNKLVVTDSVFSMEGDLAPLPGLLALCERYGAWLVVDDAHGFGVLGEHGRGALEHFGLRSSQLIYIGTLGKAAGVAGAFVAAHAQVIEWLVQRARSYIYTTASPPAIAHALMTSLDILCSEEGRARRAALSAHVRDLRAALRLQRWQALPTETPIQPVVIGANEATVAAGAALRERGYWVGTIRPPTVPAGSARLRITLSATHTPEHIAALAAAVNEIERTSV